MPSLDLTILRKGHACQGLGIPSLELGFNTFLNVIFNTFKFTAFIKIPGDPAMKVCARSVIWDNALSLVSNCASALSPCHISWVFQSTSHTGMVHYCHHQQTRPETFHADIARVHTWGGNL